MTFDVLMKQKADSLTRKEKDKILFDGLIELTRHHKKNCPEYNNILEAIEFSEENCQKLDDLPFIPVNLFKTLKLHSVQAPEEIVTVLNSSGTSGQIPSSIYLDRETSRRQSLGLTQSIQSITSGKRLPMLIVDSPSQIKKKPLTARGAGILGLMRFGHAHTFILNEDLSLNLKGLEQFLEKHGEQPFLIFGFTFMVWSYLFKNISSASNLTNGILIHSGGWKKLQEEAVSLQEFNQAFSEKTGLQKTYNFYGMVEQIGSIFLEGPDGYLYPPNFSKAIIRDPYTLASLPEGEEGLIQLVSLLPKSYPGHSILTSDMGRLHPAGISDLAQQAGLEVTRRAPKAEIRGCSDTHTASKR
ncbi:acyl-protein synthetase [Kiloniella litopenaei]|uniref:LuxE/PaaK family acyltransferase n=1 Tax=Kiloniella litopenaei TaxID=1549748 RepID=UPI003BA94682